MAIAGTRRTRIRSAGADEVSLPKDVADVLGSEAELEVGSGQVTIRRRGKRTPSELSAIAKPTKTAQQLLGHVTRPLTDAERAGLTAFLDG